MRLYNLHVWELTEIPHGKEEWDEVDRFKKDKVETVLFVGKNERDVLNQYYRSLGIANIKPKRRSGKVWEYNNSYVYIETEHVDEITKYGIRSDEVYKVELKYKGDK